MQLPTNTHSEKKISMQLLKTIFGKMSIVSKTQKNFQRLADDYRQYSWQSKLLKFE
jgi:hypothetical protein